MSTATVSATAVSNTRGAALMLSSVMMFAIMDALVKWLGATYPVHQIVFFRCAAAMVPVMVLVWQSGGIATLRTRRPFLHLLRAAFGLASMACIFYAFTLMKLADAIAVIFSAPLFLTALSVPLLGEIVGIRRWSAICVGFLGILVIVNPSTEVLDIGALSALGGALGFALAMIVVRRLSVTDSVACISFWFTLPSLGVAAAMIPWLGWITPSWQDVLMLSLVGLIGGVAQQVMTAAFRHGEAAVVAPMEYTSMIWVTVIGYVIWSEVPDLRTLIGVAVVIASGLFMLYREAVLAGMRPVRLPKLRNRH